MKTFFSNKIVEVGLDEAGRGCLMGPVFAAAVILPKNFYHPLLNDSKKVKEKDREILRDFITAHAIDFAIASVSNQEVDKINILQSSIKAMHLCVAKLKIQAELLLVDGNYFKPYLFIPHQCIVKGDAKFAPIAAASILAKTARDTYVEKLHKIYPQYQWNKNKGYGTKKHLELIKQYGLNEHYRFSFKIKN